MKGKIFNAQEVQALLNGSKVMFREVIKPRLFDRAEINKKLVRFGDETGYRTLDQNHKTVKSVIERCPYQVGQKIFCKESFWAEKKTNKFLCDYSDDMVFQLKKEDVFRKPAQHMKQEHSRLTLQIKSIGVERLQDISEENAIKEGLDLDSEHSRLCFNIQDQPYSNDLIDGSAFKTIFAKNWNSTHKKPEEKFEANPWVWKVQFEVINN